MVTPMPCPLLHRKFFKRCSFFIMERSSLSISWLTMILSLRLPLSPLSDQWLEIRLSRPPPMFHLESTNIPRCLVLIMIHHLLPQSLDLPVFSCFKHHRLPTSGLVGLHNSQHLHNLLFPTQPNLLILFLKVHFLLLVYLLVLSIPELFRS